MTTVVNIDKESGLVYGLFSTNRFYHQALSTGHLTVFVFAAGAGYSVRLMHGPSLGAPAPTMQQMLSEPEKYSGRFLLSEYSTGFFGEEIRIDYSCTSSVAAAKTQTSNSSAVANPIKLSTPPTKTKTTTPTNSAGSDGPAVGQSVKTDVTVTEEMPDGSKTERRRGRPPGSKNKPRTKEDLFDDANFTQQDLPLDQDDVETVASAVAVAAQESDYEDVESTDSSDLGDENEDGDEELPFAASLTPLVTEDDIRSADARQLVELAKRMQVAPQPGMTAGMLRKQLLTSAGFVS